MLTSSAAQVRPLRARLLREAFEEDPTLADRVEKLYRSWGVRAAVRAGRGEDGTPWREQAMVWLEADLQAWENNLDAGTAKPALARKVLSSLKRDPILKTIVTGSYMTGLTARERKRWNVLWARLNRLLKRLAP